MMTILEDAGIPYFMPEGAYYALTDISKFGYSSDIEFTEFLVKEIGVAVVPGSSFFSRQELGRNYVRFCFSRKDETFEIAQQRLSKLKNRV